MVIVWKRLRQVIGCEGIVLFPFIILTDPKYVYNAQIMNHERIHIRQALELLVIPFYILYLTEYCIKRISSKSQREAYLKISFEREAYANDMDAEYLKKRRAYGFIHYF